MGWTTTVTPSGAVVTEHTNTRARNMKQHRAAKREQAEERNSVTPLERTRSYRLAKQAAEAR